MENSLPFEIDRSEICTEVSFTSPELMWTLIMKLPYTEVKVYLEVKSQTGLSSLRDSCERALIFKKSRFHWKKQPFKKCFIVEEELDCIDIDDIGNLEDSPRLVVFIDEDCGNLIVVNDIREPTRNINQMKKSEVL